MMIPAKVSTNSIQISRASIADKPTPSFPTPGIRGSPGLTAALAWTLILTMAVAAVAEEFQRGRLHEFFLPGLTDEPLRLILAFCTVATAVILVVVVRASLRIAYASRRNLGAARLKSEIFEKLAMHAALGNQTAALTLLAARHPRSVEQALAELIPSIRGYQSERLVKLEVSLGFEAQRFQYRASHRVSRRERKSLRRFMHSGAQDRQMLYAVLAGADETERVVAASTLIRTGEAAALGRVLTFATTQVLSIRALLIEELRAHLLELDPATIYELLESDDPQQLEAILEIIVTWQRVFEVPAFDKLLAALTPRVRALALRALPLIAGMPPAEAQVCAALSSSYPDVRAAAAFAAGELKFTIATDSLTVALHDPQPYVAIAAAKALVSFGPVGASALHRAVEQGGSAADAAI